MGLRNELLPQLFPKGARVRLSGHGRAQTIRRNRERRGVVAGYARRRDCVHVKWDGRATTEALGTGWIELEPESPAPVPAIDQ